MQRIIRSFGFFVLLLSVLHITSCAPTKMIETVVTIPNYELEAMPVGIKGTYLIKVWTYSVDPMPDFVQIKRNAVHGVIFKGFEGKPGIPGQDALAPDPNMENVNAAFFETFFADGGMFLHFVELVNNGAIAAENRIRMGNLFKIGVVCSVKAADLREYLEEAGIIRRLGEGFQ